MILADIPEISVFRYVFTITNAFQGVWISLFYVLFEGHELLNQLWGKTRDVREFDLIGTQLERDSPENENLKRTESLDKTSMTPTDNAQSSSKSIRQVRSFQVKIEKHSWMFG